MQLGSNALRPARGGSHVLKRPSGDIVGVGVYKFERGEELWRTTCRNRRFGGKSLINTLVRRIVYELERPKTHDIDDASVH